MRISIKPQLVERFTGLQILVCRIDGVLVCGAPGIGEDILRGTSLVAVDYITKFCGGTGRLET